MKADRAAELIAKLKAITVAAGATEEEALAAATKAQELCDRYGLSLEGVEIDEKEISTGRKRHTPMDRLWPAIAWRCRCSFYFSSPGRGDQSPLMAVYVGLDHNVIMAEWLHGMLTGHIKRAAEAYRRDPGYKRRKPERRRLAAAAFVEEMVQSLVRRLYADVSGPEHLQEIEAAQAARDQRHHDLTEAKALPTVGGLRDSDSARQAGRKAGRSVAINTPISGGSASSPPALIGFSGEA